MDRRDFLKGMAGAGAALAIPAVACAGTAGVTDAPMLQEVINNRLSRRVLSVYGGTSKEAVDADLFADVTSYHEAGRFVSVIADDGLSRMLAKLRTQKSAAIWIARLDSNYDSPEADGEYEVARSFIASLRLGPDVLVFQTPEDRIVWKGQDWLERGWLSGHAVSLGVISDSREELFQTVYATQKGLMWEYTDLDDVNTFFNGEDVSSEFRRFITAANEAQAA